MVCEALDEDRYDPDLDPADFELEFTGINPYFPLVPGNEWVYEGEDEVVTVRVLDETKLINGVTCVVVNDLVTEDGLALEDTDDWYGQHSDGTVYYFGELSRNYEVFEGDDPEVAELVDLDGSFKAGIDGAKAGVLMLGSPAEGAIYRQEWALAEAEDIAAVVKTGYGYGSDAVLDAMIPEDLAEALCDDDCVVTNNYTPLEPGVEEIKFYAPGIGFFYEIKPEDGESVQIVSCNSGPRCDDIP